jgi:hypothetical protein
MSLIYIFCGSLHHALKLVRLLRFRSCLVAAPNMAASSASVLSCLQAGDCFTTNSALLRKDICTGGSSSFHVFTGGVCLPATSNSDSSVSVSVCLGFEPSLGCLTRHYLLLEFYVVVQVTRPIWPKNGPVICHSHSQSHSQVTRNLWLCTQYLELTFSVTVSHIQKLHVICDYVPNI